MHRNQEIANTQTNHFFSFTLSCRILSQIISVSKEVLEYREWVKQNECKTRSPDPADLALPSKPAATNSKDVEPKSLPATWRRTPENEMGSKNHGGNGSNPKLASQSRPNDLTKQGCEAAKPASGAAKPVLPGSEVEAENEDSDSVCSVSSGRASSVLTTASSAESVTSNDERLTHERLNHHNSQRSRGGNPNSSVTSDTVGLRIFRKQASVRK